MKKWVIGLLILVSLPILFPLVLMTGLFAVVATGTDREHWNQRVTIVIETPGGEVSGRVVQRVDWEGTRGLYKSITSGSDAGQTSIRVTGEALALEVTPGRWLFALLKGDNGWQGEPGLNAGYVIAVPKGHHARSAEGVDDILAYPKDQPLELPPEAWPMLVTFDDITKPETVRRVDPADLAAVFGAGVRLKAAKLEVTDAAVTEGRVEGVLGTDFFLKWAKRHKEELAKDNTMENPYFQSLAARMYKNVFIEGSAQ
ncbi:hypothetical protein [Neogemmobacter tilapiae]|uniref:Uncharacterized protein n=1 Tax=Neogemmobacter tilapiae TaxID=875041 RepID=A0A918TMS2_9RHOB|nr:hypothetical protein [Gemmobacter tilapiae]GHC49029.1 hypothetical protein GCM10007315_08900 [Gemmobacter tilapiae]